MIFYWKILFFYFLWILWMKMFFWNLFLKIFFWKSFMNFDFMNSLKNFFYFFIFEVWNLFVWFVCFCVFWPPKASEWRFACFAWIRVCLCVSVCFCVSDVWNGSSVVLAVLTQNGRFDTPKTARFDALCEKASRMGDLLRCSFAHISAYLNVHVFWPPKLFQKNPYLATDSAKLSDSNYWEKL